MLSMRAGRGDLAQDKSQDGLQQPSAIPPEAPALGMAISSHQAHPFCSSGRDSALSALKLFISQECFFPLACQSRAQCKPAHLQRLQGTWIPHVGFLRPDFLFPEASKEHSGAVQDGHSPEGLQHLLSWPPLLLCLWHPAARRDNQLTWLQLSPSQLI